MDIKYSHLKQFWIYRQYTFHILLCVGILVICCWLKPRLQTQNMLVGLYIQSGLRSPLCSLRGAGGHGRGGHLYSFASFATKTEAQIGCGARLASCSDRIKHLLLSKNTGRVMNLNFCFQPN